LSRHDLYIDTSLFQPLDWKRVPFDDTRPIFPRSGESIRGIRPKQTAALETAGKNQE
jgi:hypothetical protein